MADRSATPGDASLRVVHVITRLIVGGAQENTVATVLGLRALPGLETRLITGPTTGPEGSIAHWVEAVRPTLTVIPSLIRPVHPWQDVRAWSALVREFRAWAPDLVHTHSGKAGVLGRLAARKAGVPVVVHTIHGPSFGPFQGPLANALFRSAEQIAGRATHHFVCVADAMRRQYLAAGIGRPERYTTIASGFNLEPYLRTQNDPERRRRLGLDPKDLVVGKVARLFKLKGHDDLFAVAGELVRRCPNLKFLLLGDGAWRARFEAQVRAMGLVRQVVFAGLVPPDEVPHYVGLMDVLVHLSRREGLPRALPQALAAGKPVVAYDCDGAGEVCVDGETGFLVSPGDRARLTESLLRLAADPGLRDRMGALGRSRVTERFPVEKMVAELHALYRQLLATRLASQGRARGG